MGRGSHRRPFGLLVRTVSLLVVALAASSCGALTDENPEKIEVQVRQAEISVVTPDGTAWDGDAGPEPAFIGHYYMDPLPEGTDMVQRNAFTCFDCAPDAFAELWQEGQLMFTTEVVSGFPVYWTKPDPVTLNLVRSDSIVIKVWDHDDGGVHQLVVETELDGGDLIDGAELWGLSVDAEPVRGLRLVLSKPLTEYQP